MAGSVRDCGGALFIPAFGGMGTPVWDFGARGTFLGLQASTGRAELLVRSDVLEGMSRSAEPSSSKPASTTRGYEIGITSASTGGMKRERDVCLLSRRPVRAADRTLLGNRGNGTLWRRVSRRAAPSASGLPSKKRQPPRRRKPSSSRASTSIARWIELRSRHCVPCQHSRPSASDTSRGERPPKGLQFQRVLQSSLSTKRRRKAMSWRGR